MHYINLLKDQWIECGCVLKVIPRGLKADEELIVRQAFAGLCWSKQFYLFDGSSLSSTGTSDVWSLFILTVSYIVIIQEHSSF